MKALYFDNNVAKILALRVASVFSKNAPFGRFSPVRYAEVEEPRIPGPRWLKVRNLSCGLCGTDVHFLFMEMDPLTFPAATPGISRKYLGHELVGEVMEVGADAGGFAPGDRVALRVDWPSCCQLEIDPPCRPCASGSYMLCENLGKASLPMVDTGGGFSPYMVVHRSQPFRIPDALDADRALLLEPAASALHGVLKRKPEAGEKVLVVGAGTIGLMTLAVTRALAPEARLHCVARHPFQAEAARRMGAEDVLLSGKTLYKQAAEATGAAYRRGVLNNEILLGGFDVVYDTVGNDRSIKDSLRWVRAGGTVVILGINFQPGKIDYTPIWNQEVTVTGINCHATESTGETSFEIAARLLADEDFPVAGMITHRFPMDRYRDAVRTFLSKGRSKAIKIVLDHPTASQYRS